MGELKHIVFNPATGLFEDSTNPTAHLTQGEVRRRRKRPTDPMAALMKPDIRSIYLTGGERPMEGSTLELSWQVDRAQRVVVTFPSGNTLEFPPACRCQFVVPATDCFVRLVAYNGKFTTQRTMQIHPKRYSRLRDFIKKVLDAIIDIIIVS